MPGKNPNGEPNVGMQLWVDLPKHLKFCEPRYRDLRASEIPVAKTDDGKVEVKVISGESLGVESLKDLAYTPVWFLDINIKPGGSVFQKIPPNWNAFAYTLSGTTNFSSGAQENKAVQQFNTVVFSPVGDGVNLSVPESSTEPSRTILVAGQVLDQKVVQYGPFVLNEEHQVYEALRDYQSHTNGFERAKGWRSEIGKSMMG